MVHTWYISTGFFYSRIIVWAANGFSQVKRTQAACLENREGGQGLGGRTSTKESAVRTSLEGVFGGTFRRWMASEGALQLHFLVNTWKDVSARLFVVGGL